MLWAKADPKAASEGIKDASGRRKHSKHQSRSRQPEPLGDTQKRGKNPGERSEAGGRTQRSSGTNAKLEILSEWPDRPYPIPANSRAHGNSKKAPHPTHQRHRTNRRKESLNGAPSGEFDQSEAGGKAESHRSKPEVSKPKDDKSHEQAEPEFRRETVESLDLDTRDIFYRIMSE